MISVQLPDGVYQDDETYLNVQLSESVYNSAPPTNVTVNISESLLISDSVSVSHLIEIIESLVISDSISGVKTINITESLLITDDAANIILKSLTDTISITDSVVVIDQGAKITSMDFSISAYSMEFTLT